MKKLIGKINVRSRSLKKYLLQNIIKHLKLGLGLCTSHLLSFIGYSKGALILYLQVELGSSSTNTINDPVDH